MAAVEHSLLPIPNSSPFLLRVDDVETLLSSTGFNILRDHLAEHYTYDLCDNHIPAHIENLSRWLLVRDALHAMLVPVVELHDKAVYLASLATHTTNPTDLEYAFTGPARSAFLWLQCFLSNPTERDWCYTRGCPACVVEHTLDSEFSVRLLYASCLLSDVHYPFTIEGPTLPSFMFFLDALRRALDADPLFGTEFFEFVTPKAVATRNGIEELIRQCVDLDVMLASSHGTNTPSSGTSGIASPEEGVSGAASPVLGALGERPSAGKAKLRVKRSKMAKRLVRLEVEQEAWMEEVLRRCWDELDESGGREEEGEEGEDEEEEEGDEYDADCALDRQKTVVEGINSPSKDEARVVVSEVLPGTSSP